MTGLLIIIILSDLPRSVLKSWDFTSKDNLLLGPEQIQDGQPPLRTGHFSDGGFGETGVRPMFKGYVSFRECSGFIGKGWVYRATSCK